MDRNKTNFLLKKDWLRFADSAKKSANEWKRSRSQNWSAAERKENVDAYMKSYEQSMARAETAPVKIVMYFADGRTEIIE